ncbi:MAG: aminotransferase class I/II-fold pyridoxal phosphate-dependent enzyme [Alphaproteobacteria bacterium]|nr:aminotransferase class I/II-fold pyridoxal phosphate-dependent enzyme [Alphaproteobacteria bacterium]
MPLNARMDAVGDYPFDRLRALLGTLEPPPGIMPIPLSLGEPQHAPPAFLAETVARETAGWSKYPPMRGTEPARAAIAAWLTRRFGLPDRMVDPETMVIPVSGTREALFMIALAAVPETKNGQKPVVLMPNPFYQVYLGAAVMAGAEPIFVPADGNNGFLPDFAAVPEDILARTALAYYCSPANPQGAIASMETMKNLVTLAREHDFLLVSDECYSELYYGDPPTGGAEACAALGDDGPDAMRNVAVMNSLSKRSSAPGLRSGFVAGDAELIRRFARLRDYGGAPPPLPLLAAASALWSDEDHVVANRALYAAKFALAEEILAGKYGYYSPAGGFYLWLDVGDGEAAARALWGDAGVRVIPGEYLAREADGYHPGAGYIRLALVHDLETTREALTRITQVL